MSKVCEYCESDCEALQSKIVELKEKLQDSEEAYKNLHDAMLWIILSLK